MLELSILISMECGKEMRVKLIEKIQKNEEKPEVNPIESMANDLDIPFNIIDE